VSPQRGAVIDLTNLVEASRGDPVLLSYFSAIREQIQQTANRQPWLTGEMTQGLVYVSFTLYASGSVERVVIVGERSVDSEMLRDAALRIVKAAAPFPPFPPSMTEGHKTVVVPLEFLLGS
jgi:protein TonB